MYMYMYIHVVDNQLNKAHSINFMCIYYTPSTILTSLAMICVLGPYTCEFSRDKKLSGGLNFVTAKKRVITSYMYVYSTLKFCVTSASIVNNGVCFAFILRLGMC